MTGQELYALYCKASIEQDCLMEAWEHLEGDDKQVWERTAQLLEAVERCQC
jgi:hypothetical protein